MKDLKSLGSFYVVVHNNDDFLRAKLILEAYFESGIRQGLPSYQSRVLYVDNNRIRCCMTITFIQNLIPDIKEISFKDLIDNY